MPTTADASAPPDPPPPGSYAAESAEAARGGNFELRTPRSPGDLFRVFNRLALQGFGGVLPIAQHELVDRERWLTPEQFVEMLSVAQVLPGPNVMNLALMFGDRAFGWRGGLAALGGMVCAPLAIVLVLTALYTRFANDPTVAGALLGMGAAAAGLIVSTGIKLLSALQRNALGRPLAYAFAAATLGAIGFLRLPLVLVIGLLGGMACTAAWRRLGS